jgi:hypothetical protein
MATPAPSIPRAAYLRLDALLAQARHLRGDLERIRRAAGAITGESGGRHTDAAVLGPAVGDADALLRQLGIAVTDDPPPPARQSPPAVPTPVAERPRTVFTLDATGRPHVIEVRVHTGPAGPRESFAVVDGTPVVQVARGHYRTAGAPPHVDLYAADADVRTAPAAGPPGWSGTDTAPLTVRKPVAVS